MFDDQPPFSLSSHRGRLFDFSFVCYLSTTRRAVVVAKALTPAAKVQEEIQDTLVKGIQAAAGELGEPLNAAIEKLPADLKQGLLQRLNGQ